MTPTERRTEMDLDGPLRVEYCVFGKFSSGTQGDKGSWDHIFMTIAEMREGLDHDTVEEALEEYEERATTWRTHDMEACAAHDMEAAQEA